MDNTNETQAKELMQEFSFLYKEDEAWEEDMPAKPEKEPGAEGAAAGAENPENADDAQGGEKAKGPMEPTPQEVFLALQSGCALISAAFPEGDDDGVYVSRPEVTFEDFWSEMFRITVKGEGSEEIAYKLNRWLLMQGDDVEAPAIIVKLYPDGMGAAYGIAAANPVDWYFRSDAKDQAPDSLQILFSSNMVLIGRIDGASVEGEKSEA